MSWKARTWEVGKMMQPVWELKAYKSWQNGTANWRGLAKDGTHSFLHFHYFVPMIDTCIVVTHNLLKYFFKRTCSVLIILYFISLFLSSLSFVLLHVFLSSFLSTFILILSGSFTYYLHTFNFQCLDSYLHIYLICRFFLSAVV